MIAATNARGSKKEKKGNARYKSRVFYILPLISIIPAVTSTSNQKQARAFCMTDLTWGCVAEGGFVAVEHEKIGSLRYGDYGLRLRLNMLLRMIKTT